MIYYLNLHKDYSKPKSVNGREVKKIALSYKAVKDTSVSRAAESAMKAVLAKPQKKPRGNH